MSSTQPAPADRQPHRGHLQRLNRSFRRILEAENKSPRTIEAYTDAVRLLANYFFKWAVAEGELEGNPMDRMKPPQLSEQPVEVVGPEHLARLLKTCEGRDFASRRDSAIILLLIDTGMRRAECAGMTLDDVDLDQRIVWVLGKGRRPRALPIGRKTAQALDRYLRAREGHRLAYLPQLWVGRNGSMRPSGVYHVVHDRARAAGLPAMRPHQLRQEIEQHLSQLVGLARFETPAAPSRKYWTSSPAIRPTLNLTSCDANCIVNPRQDRYRCAAQGVAQASRLHMTRQGAARTG
jgi:site-specific recombinase XerC